MKQVEQFEPDIKYSLPVIVHYRGEDLPSTLTVTRYADGTFWEAKLYTRDDLWSNMNQTATPLNGGSFKGWDDELFLERVQLVYDFVGGIDFDFVPRGLDGIEFDFVPKEPQ